MCSIRLLQWDCCRSRLLWVPYLCMALPCKVYSTGAVADVGINTSARGADLMGVVMCTQAALCQGVMLGRGHTDLCDVQYCAGPGRVLRSLTGPCGHVKNTSTFLPASM